MENTDPISMTYGQAVDLTSRIEQTLPLTGAGAPTTTTPAWYVGQRYLDTSTNEVYYCAERPASGTTDFVWLKSAEPGRVKILTSADVNYPANNPNQIALWLLEPGVYNSDGSVTLRFDLDYGGVVMSRAEPIWIGDTTNSANQLTKTFLYRNDGVWYTSATRAEDGDRVGKSFKALNPPTIVQTTGNSTTSVMSQNATTSMIYADPSTKRRVQIGGTYAPSVDGNIEIGYQSDAQGAKAIAVGDNALANGNPGIVALGAYSGVQAGESSQGTVYINSRQTAYGYNNSNYRLLTGLYDPQNDHDAANKEYVDTAVAGAGAEEITSEDWSALWQ